MNRLSVWGKGEKIARREKGKVTLFPPSPRDFFTPYKSREPVHRLAIATTQNAKLSGRLREVIAYKNRTTGGLFEEEVQAHLLYGR